MNIVTGISWYYLTNTAGKNQARPFLDSLHVVKTAQPWVVCLDFKPDRELRSLYPHCNFVHSDEIEKSLTRFQPTDGFGSWLTAFPDATDTSIVLQTDADVIVQRDFTVDELELVRDTRTLCVGPNCGDNDNLADEGKRIGIAAPELSDTPCYNGGAMLASVGMFKQLKAAFDAGWDDFCKLSTHRSRSQFHLCKVIHNTPSISVTLMPRTLHTHGHFGLPAGCEFKYGKLFHKGELVALRHNL